MHSVRNLALVYVSNGKSQFLALLYVNILIFCTIVNILVLTSFNTLAKKTTTTNHTDIIAMPDPDM